MRHLIPETNIFHLTKFLHVYEHTLKVVLHDILFSQYLFFKRLSSSCKSSMNLSVSEAVAQRCSVKKVFLEGLQRY